jgi:hypothetical protein
MQAYIARLAQVVAEDKFSKSGIKQKVLKDLSTGIESTLIRAILEVQDYLDGDYYKSKNIRIEHLKSKFNAWGLVQEVLFATIPGQQAKNMQSCAGLVAVNLKFNDIFDGVKSAAELIACVCNSNAYDIISTDESLLISSNITLENVTIESIETTKNLPPMLCRPKVISSNFENGYMTLHKSVLIGKSRPHDMPIGLDVINIQNNVELCLDENMLQYNEESNKPLDTKEKRDNHLKMQMESTVVYQELLNKGNKFYLTHSYDSRGRHYANGYFVNYQSGSYKRSLINLNNKVQLTGVPL